MLQQLLDDDILGTELVSPEKIKRAQLRKLVVSSIIDPLTVLFNCTNGEVFNSKPRMALLRLLVRETGRIARGLLDDLSDEDWQVFSGNPLRDLVVSVSAKTSQSTSSMLQDVRAGRRTEIDYINGYLTMQADRLRLKWNINDTIIRMVKQGLSLEDRDIPEIFPLSGYKGRSVSLTLAMHQSGRDKCPTAARLPAG